MKDRKGLCTECQRDPCACRSCGHFESFEQCDWNAGHLRTFRRCAKCGEPFKPSDYAAPKP